MNDTDRGTDVFQCRSCGNVGIGQGEIGCCDEPMTPVDTVEDPEPAVDQPSLDDLLQTVFDMSDTELDICLCVMEAGELTASDLAEQIDYDRSVVARHLNHLAEMGVVEKRRKILEQGGHVYVYTPNAPETVRQNLQELFLVWVQEAAVQLDALRREKVESIVANEHSKPEWTVFHQK
jgi:predicted transcriptional regulator